MSPTLSRALLGLVVLLCAVAQLFLLRSILRTSAASSSRGYEDDRRKNRRRGGFRWGAGRRTQPESGEGERSNVSEIAWVVIPAFGLTALLYFAWLALPAR